MIKIIVCMKQVIDPEAPASMFRIDPEVKRAIPPKGTPPVLNPFDENALEAALKIKDTKDAEITVISMGPNLAKPVVRKSLAVGADKLMLLEDVVFVDLDSCSTAQILATAIKKMEEYDLILCGREASDTNAGQVGSGIADILGIPCITIARKIEVRDKKTRVERAVSDGYEVIEAPLPALVTASNEIGELRSAGIKLIMATQRKPVTIWSIQDIGIELSTLRRTKMLKLFIPERNAKCQMISGDTPEEAAENLALRLIDEKII